MTETVALPCHYTYIDVNGEKFGGFMAVKLMPGMTLEQQISGARRAIKTLRERKSGPVWLIPSLRKRLRALEAERLRRKK